MTVERWRRVGTGACFVVFPLVWVFAFAVHPQLLQPHWMPGPEALIARAHGNALLQFAHVLVTLNMALAVVVAMHFQARLTGSRAEGWGVVGAGAAVLGACLLAADKGAMCLTMSALDTLPEKEFTAATPGLVAVFSYRGWMALVLGMMLLPVGVIVQCVGLLRANALPRRQVVTLMLALVFIAFPDGAEIVNLAAALLLTSAMLPYGLTLLRDRSGADRAVRPAQPARPARPGRQGRRGLTSAARR